MARIAIGVACAAMLVSSAAAQPLEGPFSIISFGFSNLDGSFDASTGQFVSRAGSLTSGDVTRLLDGDSAEYGVGFVNADSLADVVFEIDLSNITSSSADGFGSFLFTDADGDQIGGDLVGRFRQAGGVNTIFFSGTLENVFALDVTGDNQFDGPTGGTFINDFSDFITPFEGAIVQFSFGPDTFFSEDFDALVQTNGLIQAFVPTPGTAGLLGLAGLVAARRRRR